MNDMEKEKFILALAVVLGDWRARRNLEDDTLNLLEEYATSVIDIYSYIQKGADKDEGILQSGSKGIGIWGSPGKLQKH